MIPTIAALLTRVGRSPSGRLVAAGLACLIGGAIAFSNTQHVGIGTSFYWAITTATTVGYGDVLPHNSTGRVLASVVMITTIPLFASAFALMAGAVAGAHLRRLLGMDHREPPDGGVLVFGMHPSVPRMVEELMAAGRQVTVVAACDRSVLPDSVRVHTGDPTNEAVIRRARPERASQILIIGTEDAEVLVTAVLVHQVAPGTPCLAVAKSLGVCQAMQELGVHVSVSAEQLLSHVLAKSLEAPHAGELLLRIVDSDGFRLKEFDLPSDGVGRRLSSLRADLDGLVLGAVHQGRVILGISEDPPLEAGDRLLVLRAESG